MELNTHSVYLLSISFPFIHFLSFRFRPFPLPHFYLHSTISVISVFWYFARNDRNNKNNKILIFCHIGHKYQKNQIKFDNQTFVFFDIQISKFWYQNFVLFDFFDIKKNKFVFFDMVISNQICFFDIKKNKMIVTEDQKKQISKFWYQKKQNFDIWYLIFPNIKILIFPYQIKVLRFCNRENIKYQMFVFFDIKKNKNLISKIWYLISKFWYVRSDQISIGIFFKDITTMTRKNYFWGLRRVS